MDYALFLVVLVTSLVIVIGGLGLALILAPRSNNPQKEAY